MTWLGSEVTAILGHILGASEPRPSGPMSRTTRRSGPMSAAGTRSAVRSAMRRRVVRRRGGGLRPPRPARAPARYPGARAGPRHAAAPRRPRRSLCVPDRPVQPRHRHQPGGVQPVTARRLGICGSTSTSASRLLCRSDKQPATTNPRYWASSVLGAVAAASAAKRCPAAQAIRAAASPRARSCGGSRGGARPPARRHATP